MKFSSVTSKLTFDGMLQTQKCQAVNTGDVVLAEVLSINQAYPYLEQADGELCELAVGDCIVGALGARQALRGFVGYMPTIIESQPLSLLNMGGVMGYCLDSAVGLGDPPRVKYIGTVIDKDGIVNFNRIALPKAPSDFTKRPIILVLGTCMNVGKTSCAAHLIYAATQAGHQVGAAKIAGVASIKDLQCFKKAGAIDVKSFLDCGLPSTVDASDLSQVVKNILHALRGDLLIVELGDGIMGHYKVDAVLQTKAIMSSVTSVVVCAADLSAAFGAKEYLASMGIAITIFSGPATDNISGSHYIEEKWQIPAVNGCKYPDKLFAVCKEHGNFT